MMTFICAEAPSGRTSSAASAAASTFAPNIMRDEIMALRLALLWADIAGPRRRLEATDGFRNHLLGQPQYHLREIDGEGDGDEEHDIDRQRRTQRLAKTDADEFRGHQQHQSIRRRDQAEGERCDQ